MEKKMLTVKEVASLLGVSTSTIRRLISSGKLTGQKAGAQWRFDPDVVKQSFEQGILSGVTDESPESFTLKTQGLREDQKVLITRWRDIILDILKRERPSHVVVRDRRGAQLWTIMAIPGYRWGDNLWHSTAIEQMLLQERSKLFDKNAVMIFDELFEHGRALRKTRRSLENAGASVSSIVCIRNLSKVETGSLASRRAYACEDVDEKVFSERVTFISRLVSVFDFPIDVDHLIIKAKIKPGVTVEQLLERLSQWGPAFIVWHPKEENGCLAITLDRPQFFDASSTNLNKGFSLDWRAPCKIRFYILPDEGVCYCSFIAYPDIEAPESVWIQEATNLHDNMQLKFTELPYSLSSKNGASLIQIIYWRICMGLAIKLLNDFVVSGAADDSGIQVSAGLDALDAWQFRAAFGSSFGSEIAKRTREILLQSKSRERLSFQGFAQNRIPLKIREETQSQGCSYDAFACRMDLLKTIPRKNPDPNSADVDIQPISYLELFTHTRLSSYSESLIGKALDNELDYATIRPAVQIKFGDKNGVNYTRATRGFMRGEFGIWFEYSVPSQSYDDKAMQRTIALGPVCVEDFLGRLKKEEMTATEFNKVFSNLNHDWHPALDKLFLGWKPYKYGPIPVIPEASTLGQYPSLNSFLVGLGALSERKEQHGSRTWRRFKPNSESDIPWRDLYEQRTSAFTRAFIKGLVRLYAKIHQDCKTTRLLDHRSSRMSVFGDPLVVLAAARNNKIAYICCWYEFEDWKQKGRVLMSVLEGVALIEKPPSKPHLHPHLKEFAAPAGILFDKIEMYRNLPYLRKQIEDLRDNEDFEIAEIVLDSMDSVPSFESNSAYPMRNIEYACGIMRAYSSMVRQILTRCNLDIEDRKKQDRVDANGITRDENYYLRELVTLCPELKSIEDEIHACIDSVKSGVFTKNSSQSLSKTFNLILKLFEERNLIPDPTPNFERDRKNREIREGLNIRLQDVPISGSYALAVADIRNLLHLAGFSEIVGSTYDEGINGLLNWVANEAKTIVEDKNLDVYLCGRPADNIILAGPNVDSLYLAVHTLVDKTSRRVSTIDRQLIPFGTLRVGVAWHDASLGKEYMGIKPGLTAYALAETSGHPSSTISITEAIYDRLSPPYRKGFLNKAGSSGQGRIFIQDLELDQRI